MTNSRVYSGWRLAVGVAGAAVFLAACGGGPTEPPAPTTGSIVVNTTTTGSGIDPDGYSVSVDGGSGQAIGVNGSITISGVDPGSASVQLSGVASNCTVSGSNPMTVTVTAGASVTAAFSVTCSSQTGDLDVTTNTTGSDLDPDGYTVSVDGGTPQAIGINATASLTGLAVGSRSVALGDIAPNCSVSGANPQSVTVTEGATAAATFDVTCAALVGDIDVTTATTGSNLDPDGYTMTVDGGSDTPVGINGMVSFTGLPVGNHDVELTDVALNCTVTGANPQTVAVTDGGTAAAAFAVTCSATMGDITVTTATSGADLDANGYMVTVDGGSAIAIGINDMASFTGLAVGNHDVELTDIQGNCSVAEANPQTVAVTDGGDTPVTFTVTCAAIPPLSGKIVFHSDRSGNFDIWVMNTNGTGLTNLTNDPARDQGPAVSPDGSKILFWSDRDGGNDIWVMNADGSGPVKLVGSGSAEIFPAWSPDGSQIAYARNQGGSIYEIYIANADGTGQMNLTNNAANDTHPAWSPDGTLIAFTSDRTGDEEIWTMSAVTGANLINLTNNPGRRDSRPDWLPVTGATITFDRNDFLGSNPDPLWFGNAEVMTMDADGGNVLRLTTDVADITDFAARYSPDGSQISFVSNRDTNNEIYIMNNDGSLQTRITMDGASDAGADWSP